MAARLGVYNSALLLLGERQLASLTENREPRRALDEAWDESCRYCLEQGLWRFALRTVQAYASPSIEPAFGYTKAFERPDDWNRTVVVSTNDTLDPPLLEYSDEQGYLFANYDPVYWQYVSNDADYGLNPSRWSETFAEYVAVRLAVKTCRRITGTDAALTTLLPLEKRYRVDARSKDAMNEAAQFPPTGTWVRSRFGGGMQRSRWGRC